MTPIPRYSARLVRYYKFLPESDSMTLTLFDLGVLVQRAAATVTLPVPETRASDQDPTKRPAIL